MPEESKVIIGTLEIYSESGTEGVYWAIQDAEFVHGQAEICPWREKNCPILEGASPVHCSYKGLHLLKDGDILYVYNKQRDNVLWNGTVSLLEVGTFTADIEGLWVHSIPNNVKPNEWMQWFLDNLPANLIKT